MNDYQDILHLPHHESQTHPRMSMTERAAQFSPFAALSGYDDAVEETERLTETFRERSEEEESRLNEITASLIRQMEQHPGFHPEVRIEYFEPDERKEGGAYRMREGQLRFIDPVAGTLEFTDRTKIRLDLLRSLEEKMIKASKASTDCGA